MNNMMIKLANLASTGVEMEKTAFRFTRRGKQRNREKALEIYDRVLGYDKVRTDSAKAADKYKGDGHLDHIMKAELLSRASDSTGRAVGDYSRAVISADKAFNPWRSYNPFSRKGEFRTDAALHELVKERGDKEFIVPVRRYKEYSGLSSPFDILRASMHREQNVRNYLAAAYQGAGVMDESKMKEFKKDYKREMGKHNLELR